MEMEQVKTEPSIKIEEVVLSENEENGWEEKCVHDEKNMEKKKKK